MELLRWVYYLFAPYASPDERAIAKFFGGLREHGSTTSQRTRAIELLQRNAAAINLWTESAYKGYNYLTKSTRNTLYRNLDIITADFGEYRARYSQTAADMPPSAAKLPDDIRQTLGALTSYFDPRSRRYEYRESSSFSRLLRDPTRDMMVGDCNQIVTLYVYLFSRYHDVRNLQVRLLPGHIALHYRGIDIEATNGTFTDYSSRADARLMPIEELISVNLLDTTDAYLDTHAVSPESLLQSARFAVILSHDRGIVEHNLDVAYKRLITSLMKRHNYSTALKFAMQSRDLELRAIVGHNGAIYHIDKNEFRSARKYASYAIERTKLVNESYHAEGVYHFNAGRYHDAIRAFRKIGDTANVKKCYEALYVDEQRKLPSRLTTESIKSHHATIKTMRRYADKSGNSQLIQHAAQLQKHL